MSFSMSIVYPEEPVLVDWDGESEVEIEEFHSLILSSCEVLAYADFDFHVSGFGQTGWPVDVWTLSSVLEDLPVILSRLREGKASSIIFGSQATERTVHLVPGPEFVDMTCETWSKTWSPEPRTESIAAPVLEKMLVELGQNFFARLVKALSLEMADVEPLPHWRQGSL